MDLTAIKNKLIVYKTYEKLPYELIQEIQSCLLNKTKEEDLLNLLKKIESKLH
jgi:hypothetical protein